MPLGCGGADEEEAALTESGTGSVVEAEAEASERVDLTIDEVKALNESLLCNPGEVVCDDMSVVQCSSTGAPAVLKTCPSEQACVEGECADMPSCTKAVCEYDGAYCPDDYPACPYGSVVGDIVENAELLDPISKDAFSIGTHYGEEGVLVLIAANGW
jgi:hypothetical protein